MILHTWIELNAAAFSHNINQIHTLIGKRDLALVLKANAYGHGLIEMGLLAQQNNHITWLCVAVVEEALALRAAGITKPILIMAPDYYTLEAGIQAGFDFAVYDQIILYTIIALAHNLNKQVRVHIKVDTGMSRLGFCVAEVKQSIKQWCSYNNILIVGIFSHLADTNNPDQTSMHQQIVQFKELINWCNNNTIAIPLQHLFASGSLDKISNDSMVRVGTMAWGFWKSLVHQQRMLACNPAITLQPVLSLKCKVIAYSQQHIYIAVGFMHGYSAALATKAYVVINTKCLAVIEVHAYYSIIQRNNVRVNNGDEVTVIGKSPALTTADHAHLLNTISNEITTTLCPKISRIIYTE